MPANSFDRELIRGSTNRRRDQRAEARRGRSQTEAHRLLRREPADIIEDIDQALGA